MKKRRWGEVNVVREAVKIMLFSWICKISMVFVSFKKTKWITCYSFYL